MSTIKSDNSNLILNADGAGSEVKFHNNGVEICKVDATGFSGNGIPTELNDLSDVTVSASDPTISSNKPIGHLWINKISGEQYVATDATTGANIWSNTGKGTFSISPWTLMDASGGTITTYGDYKVHTFLSSGTFSVASLGSVTSIDVLLVGGGGSGGAYTLTASYNNGQTGSNTTGFGNTALGGGGGGKYASNNGQNGGSGGGGGAQYGNGGSGTSGQGFGGGNTVSPGNKGGGGGGGAGGVGTAGNDTPGSSNGVGGIGKENLYRTGVDQYYAGGGGAASAGGASYPGGVGGLGGGGNGGSAASAGDGLGNGVSGTANTGGGGGAGDYGWGAAHGGGGAGGMIVTTVSNPLGGYNIIIGAGAVSAQVNDIGGPGNGGSGIVVIRYRTTA
jgi:hypothetical protein